MHFLFLGQAAENKQKMWKKAEKCGKIVIIKKEEANEHTIN